MKLTRCYIENFGTLHQFELVLDGGLSVIKAPNGFGKTTFAAFIRAMLYGFPRANKVNLDKDPRRKYSPWQGGRFGGCIEFELEGKNYRLERFFGDKPSRDSFAVYELPEMRPCKRFTEDIGTELFGLDSDSFERSTYMTQLGETGALSTDAITARLSNLVEDTGDSVSYEKALAILRKARSALLPYKGNGGEVNKASDRITALQTELGQLSARREQLPGLYKEIAELEKSIDDINGETEKLQSELIAATEQAAAEAAYREKLGLQRRCSDIKAELDSLMVSYPGGMPPAEEIQRMSACAQRLEALGESSSDKAAKLLKKSEEAEKAEDAPKEKKKSPAAAVLLIIAALLAAGGTVVAIIKSFLIGGIIFAVGLLFAAGGLYVHYSKIAEEIEEREKNNALNDEVEALLREYAKQSEDIEAERRQCEIELRDFLDNYELVGLNCDSAALGKIRDDAVRLGELKKRLDSAKAELAEFEKQHPDITAPTENKANPGLLRAKYSELGRMLPELNRRLAEKRREAAAVQEKSERIGEAENELEHWKSVKSEGLTRAKDMDSAMEYLRIAKESLSESYMDDIESGFVRYFNRLAEDENSRVFLDSDLSVKLEKSGEARRLEQFSTGFSDIVMLCMRLALIDAMFREEKPFIIMDDPFVNLDDEHTKKALELVKSLGSEYQVIYLVCNSSRSF